MAYNLKINRSTRSIVSSFADGKRLGPTPTGKLDLSPIWLYRFISFRPLGRDLYVVIKTEGGNNGQA